MEAERLALVIVDVQPTFCEGGALPVTGGNAVAHKIADFVTEHSDEYELIVTTQDWHIEPGAHFSSEPDYVDTWPPHAVAGTPEAELHDEIAALSIDDSVKKGEYSAAYSGFEGHNTEGETLEQILRGFDIQGVDVVGLAESHCVKDTALDALRLGWPTRVFSDLTAPVSPELGKAARAELDEAGVEQLSSAKAFGFYDPGDDQYNDEFSDERWNDTDWDHDEAGAADFMDDELPRVDEPGTIRETFSDNYDDDADAELTSDGEEEELDYLTLQTEAAELAGVDWAEFGLDDAAFADLDLDALEDVDFSDDADEGDFDFSDIDPHRF